MDLCLVELSYLLYGIDYDHLITFAYWMLFPLPNSVCYMEFYPLHVLEFMI